MGDAGVISKYLLRSIVSRLFQKRGTVVLMGVTGAILVTASTNLPISTVSQLSLIMGMVVLTGVAGALLATPFTFLFLINVDRSP